MKKRISVFVSVFAVFAAFSGASVLTGCGGDKIEINSRTDENVTENNSGITYDVNESSETDSEKSGNPDKKQDSGEKGEKKEGKEKKSDAEKKDSQFLFSTKNDAKKEDKTESKGDNGK